MTRRDQAEALPHYSLHQKLSLEMQNRCAEIKIQAERRAGGILLDMENNPSGQAERESYLSDDGTGRTPKLADLGSSRNYPETKKESGLQQGSKESEYPD